MPGALLERAVYRLLHVHYNYFALPKPLCLGSVVLVVLAVETLSTLLLYMAVISPDRLFTLPRHVCPQEPASFQLEPHSATGLSGMNGHTPRLSWRRCKAMTDASFIVLVNIY